MVRQKGNELLKAENKLEARKNVMQDVDDKIAAERSTKEEEAEAQAAKPQE